MKKLPLLTLLFLALFMRAFSQYIPNGDMEDWIPVTGYDSLVNWTSTNLFFAPNVSVTKTTDVHGGSFAARMNGTTFFGILPVPGGIGTNAKVDLTLFTVTGGYPFTQRPDAFTGWYKYTPSNNDSCVILAVLTKWTGTERDTIGIAALIGKTALTSYTSFNLPFFYFSTDNPDTAFVLALTSANFLAAQTGSVLYVDDLDFTIGTGVNNIPSTGEIINTYPNPARDQFNIELQPGNGVTTLLIFDVLGNKVKTMNVTSNNIKITTSSFADGLYFYRLEDKNNAALASGKFSVKH